MLLLETTTAPQAQGGSHQHLLWVTRCVNQHSLTGDCTVPTPPRVDQPTPQLIDTQVHTWWSHQLSRLPRETSLPLAQQPCRVARGPSQLAPPWLLDVGTSPQLLYRPPPVRCKIWYRRNLWCAASPLSDTPAAEFKRPTCATVQGTIDNTCGCMDVCL